VQDSVRLASFIAFDDAADRSLGLRGDPSQLQRGAVGGEDVPAGARQHHGPAGHGFIKIVASGLAPFGHRGFVESAPLQPFARW
jgi:hypothetical protein